MPKLGYHQTEEHKANQSASHMGQVAWNKGILTTKETKAKQSTAHMGHVVSLETCTKMSVNHTGLKASPETCEKISTSNMGHTVSPETRIKMSEANINPSLETRMKMSASAMGRKASPEACAKMSTSHWKGGWIEAMRRRAFKRHGLGFIPLNEPFLGCEGHHYDTEHVIYTLKELHRSVSHNVFTGRGMDKINTLVFAWYTEDWT